MAELPKNTEIRRDETGIARSIRIPRSAGATAKAVARGARVPTTVREVADSFVIQASPLLRLDQSNLTELAPSSVRKDATPTDKMQLSFREEKGVSGSATVVYDQKVLGLPVWNSGLTVQIATDGLRVLSSQNQLDYDMEINRLSQTGLLPSVVTVERLAPLFGLPGVPAGLVINGTRQLIYRYQAGERLDPAVQVRESGPLQGPPPTLPLPPVPASIVEGRHYVVTEVLFTLPLPSQGSLNWRAFVEPTTATVLYLRALVACLHGAVFLTDATLPDGRVVSVDSTEDELNSVRSVVPLAGLSARSGSNRQCELRGEFVELRETGQPVVPAPVVDPPSEFIYDVRTSDFAAVCAYHHCDGLFRLVQEMGIDVKAYFDGTSFPVPVDHYGFDLQVNARAPGNIAGNGSRSGSR
jgi:zinc metalloprotease ZmpB